MNIRAVVEAFAPVAQVLDEFPVGVDVGVETPELAEQDAVGLGVARVGFPRLGIEQVVKEERTVFDAVGGRYVRLKPTQRLG